MQIEATLQELYFKSIVRFNVALGAVQQLPIAWDIISLTLRKLGVGKLLVCLWVSLPSVIVIVGKSAAAVRNPSSTLAAFAAMIC